MVRKRVSISQVVRVTAPPWASDLDSQHMLREGRAQAHH